MSKFLAIQLSWPSLCKLIIDIWHSRQQLDGEHAFKERVMALLEPVFGADNGGTWQTACSNVTVNRFKSGDQEAISQLSATPAVLLDKHIPEWDSYIEVFDNEPYGHFLMDSPDAVHLHNLDWYKRPQVMAEQVVEHFLECRISDALSSAFTHNGLRSYLGFYRTDERVRYWFGEGERRFLADLTPFLVDCLTPRRQPPSGGFTRGRLAIYNPDSRRIDYLDPGFNAWHQLGQVAEMGSAQARSLGWRIHRITIPYKNSQLIVVVEYSTIPVEFGELPRWLPFSSIARSFKKRSR